MKLQLVTKDTFDSYYNKLSKDFCIEERKTKADELDSTLDERFKIYNILDKDNIVGYISIWEFDSFIFIEHLAIEKHLRGKGIGSRFLKEYTTNTKKTIVLEIE